ncbi:hypothetical protein SPF06_18290 [Sinomonas sp. JGH33]|uniref:Secreted protein n=1 Tax=Sinomonas terricola TaxID=3110330 RepID=A0ABU5TAG9_9MICC|nr:hypothetical protein [Sinomonas sp. JGH33]MEA5456677.1 hypothetical protein [Sinomonas sp. JGH33]
METLTFAGLLVTLFIFPVGPNQSGAHLFVSSAEPLNSSSNAIVQLPATPFGWGVPVSASVAPVGDVVAVGVALDDVGDGDDVAVDVGTGKSDCVAVGVGVDVEVGVALAVLVGVAAAAVLQFECRHFLELLAVSKLFDADWLAWTPAVRATAPTARRAGSMSLRFVIIS